MKTKYWLLGLGLLLAIGGSLVGRGFWRVHRQLVTLDVREAPLAEVLRKIERQTWKKIRAEKALDARITLRVKNKPLPYVLDRLAEQAGAHWSTLYAVYGSGGGLRALDSALRGDGKLEPAGWTKIAPTVAAPSTMADEAQPSLLTPNSKGSGAMTVKRRVVMIRHGPNGPVMFQGGPQAEMEIWSAEELILESSLRTRLDKNGGSQDAAATAAGAAATARKLKAQWTTYLAFRKSSLAVGFGQVRPSPPDLDHGIHAPDPNERFARLTPEQRVQRARQWLSLDEK